MEVSLGGLGVVRVTKNHWKQHCLIERCICVSISLQWYISYRCPYLAPLLRYSVILVENRRSELTHLYLAPPLGVTLFEFRGDLWQQKTRVHGLRYDAVFVILCLAVLVQWRLVTDGRTNRRTDRRKHDDSKNYAKSGIKSGSCWKCSLGCHAICLRYSYNSESVKTTFQLSQSVARVCRR